MFFLDIEEVPKLIQALTERIDSLEYALVLAGICPNCGTNVVGVSEGDGKLFACKCGHKTWLSNKAIKNLQHGKDITT